MFRVRGLVPVQLLDDIGRRLLDDSSHLAEGVTAPVAQRPVPLDDQFGSIRHIISSKLMMVT